MGHADQARVVLYIEFGFLAIGAAVSGIIILFPTFFLDVILQEFNDEEKREHLRSELNTLTTIGAAVIAIALLIWLIIVLTLCQGVRGILLGLGGLASVVIICLPSFYVDYMLDRNQLDPDTKTELKKQLPFVISFVAAVVVIVLLVWLLIVLLLYVGSKERSIGRLLCWLIINCLVCALHIFSILFSLFLSPPLLILHIPNIIFLSYRIWSLYVIRTFMDKIQYAPPPLTQPPPSHYSTVNYGAHGAYYADNPSSSSRLYSQPTYS